MAEVTAYTADKTEELMNEQIISGAVVGDNLILERRDTSTFNAGNVRGSQGDVGPAGATSIVVVADIAARDAISGGALFEGLHAYVVSEKLVYYYNGTVWVLETGGIPHTELAQEPVSTSGMTSATFADFAVPVEKTITKHRDDTKLIVIYNGSIWNNNTGEFGGYEVAVRIDGLDHVLCNGYGDVGPKSGTTEILGLAADDYLCKLKRRRPNSVGTVFDGQSADAWNSFTVTETF